LTGTSDGTVRLETKKSNCAAAEVDPLPQQFGDGAVEVYLNAAERKDESEVNLNAVVEVNPLQQSTDTVVEVNSPRQFNGAAEVNGAVEVYLNAAERKDESTVTVNLETDAPRVAFGKLRRLYIASLAERNKRIETETMTLRSRREAIEREQASIDAKFRELEEAEQALQKEKDEVAKREQELANLPPLSPP
jgi:hypothetical protein